MKKTLKKAMALGLVASMTALTACGSSGTASTTAAASSEAADTESSEAVDESKEKTEASGEVTTINVPAWDAATRPYVQKLVDGFEAANPNIKVNLIDVASADYVNKLTIMLNGGNDCDVVWIKEADTTPSLVERGQLEDLTPYIERDGFDTSKLKGFDALNIDGSQVALPISTSFYLLYYNKDIFDKAGVDYPSNDMTWSDFEDLCGKLTSGEGADKIYGGFLHTWQACVENWAVQDGKNTILGPDYSFMKPAYEMALRLQDAGYIMDYSTLKTSNIHYSTPFAQGTVAMLPMGQWYCSTLIQKIKDGESTVNWGVATLPHPDGVEAGWTVGSTTPIGVNANSKNKDAAWEFVKYVCGAEGAKIYAEGGEIPAYQDEETMAALTSTEGMPEEAKEVFDSVKNISLDRPINKFSAEVNQMLGEEHSLIMIGELSIDDGLAEMAERSAEIQGLN